jgi:RimJ/RimL family protein N-acetyltransferase
MQRGDSRPPTLTTNRLVLRGWRATDLPAFATMNADPRVMAYFERPLSSAESDALAARIHAHFDVHGFGLWAMEIPGVAEFAGFCGLSVPAFAAHFTPCVEIGWRLGYDHWHRGYATEAARAVLRAGFTTFGLTEIVSFTTAENLASRRVMERIGMRHDAADDFDHQGLPPGHRHRPHVLYRIARTDWNGV